MSNPEGFVELLTADCLRLVTYMYQCRKYTVQYLDDNSEVIEDNDELQEVSDADYQVPNEEEEKKNQPEYKQSQHFEPQFQ